MTKALRPKHPALIPMLDTVVQKYLQDDDVGAQAPFGERAPGLVRGLCDLDHNEAMALAVRQELAMRSYGPTEVRILDLLILSVTAAARRLALTGLFAARAGKPSSFGSEQTRRLGVCLPVT